MTDPDDAIARALAEAGLPAEPAGDAAEDPLTRSMRAAGLAVPDAAPEPEPAVDEALAELASRDARRVVVTER
ncbi:MAG: hypothetical protein L0H84_09890, partial [Pseudonocardia sp.]|nr:hypothetical protein [Pseudonocardia sp.]